MDPMGEDIRRARGVLLALEDSVRPDIIHLNSFREASYGWRTPVVVAAHSCVGSWWRACRGEEVTERKWLRYATAVRAGLQSADAWIAPTSFFRDEVQARYAPPCAGHVIWNGIGPVLAGNEKKPFILAAGRLWDEAKNLAALGGIADKIAWPIMLAGPLSGPDGEISCPPGLTWLGELSGAHLHARMLEAQIFVSPAHYEPFGLTVLEAAAAGCALVLSDIGSLRELWDGAALFLDARDATSLAHALDDLCHDDKERTRLQRAARSRAQRYSLARTADATVALYATVLNARRRKPRRQSTLELCA
jgi:glycosyltransferase involved in cell wall biosynthesis